MDQLPPTFCLVSYVRQSLAAAGLEPELCNHFDNSRFIVALKNLTPEQQRVGLNKFLSLHLTTAPASSINERYALIPDGSLNDWVRLFNDVVLPFLVKHRLPRVSF